MNSPTKQMARDIFQNSVGQKIWDTSHPCEWYTLAKRCLLIARMFNTVLEEEEETCQPK